MPELSVIEEAIAMNYTESIEYIHSISWCFCKPGLERISELCKMLGEPQKSLKFIHVAGTNGKGSFCAMLDSILRAAGYKVGLFVSPYVKEFNERITYDGKPISGEALAEITSYVRPFADSMAEKPTEFELITAIGFEYFRRVGCDVVILETGMGGRFDSTNIIDAPLLSVITGISIDHTAFLGDTVEKIAYEKAGIIKESTPALFGGADTGALGVISEYAELMGSPLYVTDREKIQNVRYSLSGTMLDFDKRCDLSLSLLGSYQPLNAANVLTAVDILKARGFNIPEDSIRAGLSSTVWHARFEILSKDPLIIYDGAHNPEGIAAAVDSVSQYFGNKRVNVLSGVMKDKDHSVIASELSKIAARVYTVTPNNPRSLSAEEYATQLEGFGVSAAPFDSIASALSAAIDESKNEGTPLVCLGSLYMYCELIAALDNLKNQ